MAARPVLIKRDEWPFLLDLGSGDPEFEAELAQAVPAYRAQQARRESLSDEALAALSPTIVAKEADEAPEMAES